MERIEDCDAPGGESRKPYSRRDVGDAALDRYKSTCTPVSKIPPERRHSEIVRLTRFLGSDSVNSRGVEYIKRRINALRGLRYDGSPKNSFVARSKRREERDPVMRTIHELQRHIEEDRRRQRKEEEARRRGL